MANLREIRRRITSVKSTQQITRAMKMVAAARLKGAENRLKAGRPYAAALDELINDLYRRSPLVGYPLLEGREEVKKIGYVLVNSDRGMCGGFNSNLIRFMQREIENAEPGVEISLTIIGRKAFDYFKHRPVNIRKNYINLLSDFDLNLAVDVGDELIEAFETEEIDEFRLVYNEYVSAISQRIVSRRLIPVQLPEVPPPTGAEAEVDYIYEPSKEGILKSLLPLQVNYQLYRSFLESFAAEMGARMAAMDAATKNAGEMIDRLTLTYNRARQNAITTELMEIINGAEALKG